MKPIIILIMTILGLGLAACTPPQDPGTFLTLATEPPATISPRSSTGTAVAPTNIAPAPTRTPTQPPTPATTPTTTPTATPTPHPLTIAWLDQLDFPGSEIVIEETLNPGANYFRYLTSYQSEDLKIYALMTVPYGDKPETGWPVVVFNHGFIPPDQYRTTERYIAYVDSFARSGYIVFRSDYRGHDNSEGEARGAYSNPDYTIDVLNAVAALQAHPEADPARIGMWGHSMGGYITLRAMLVSDEIKAGVIWAGVVGDYPNLFLRPTQIAPGGNGAGSEPTPDLTRGRGRWRQSLIDTYGTPEENPEFWASISSSTYLENLSGPLQLHHGTADTSVPVAASEYLQAELETAERYSELYVYPGDDHNLSVAFTAAMQRSIEFFNKYVKGGAP